MSELTDTRNRVAVITTGGTIASVRAGESGAVAVGLPASQLLAGIGHSAAVNVGPIEDLARVNGWNVDPALMWHVAGTVRQLIGLPDVDGVVVTHGTDTIEETAFLVDVLTPSEKPVVFTAAMRSADATSPDGPHNLASALRAAASSALRGLGAVLCLNDTVHAARWARKTHSSRVDAFTSAPGPVATVDPDGKVRRLRGSLEQWTVPDSSRIHRVHPETVPVVQAYTGMSAAALENAVDTETARGVVLEGFGVGNVPGTLVDAIRKLIARGLIVAVSTRVSQGGTWPVYGGPGSGTELTEMGVLGAGTLATGKARLLLLACLAGEATADAAQTFQKGVEVLGRGTEGWSSWS